MCWTFYDTLENEVIPRYFARNAAGVPEGWIAVMKNSIRTCTPAFSMARMVKEYATTYYLPSIASGARYHENGYALARQMAEWKTKMRNQWPSLTVQPVTPSTMQIAVGQPLELTANVWLNGLSASAVALEIVAGRLSTNGELINPQIAPMQVNGDGSADGRTVYHGQLAPTDSGQIAIGIRARPIHDALIHPYETGLNHWA